MSTKPCILFLDAYDSFSHNIIALLKAQCNVQVTKAYIDDDIPNLQDFLTPFTAVVCGPGPGHPLCSQDVGLFKEIWALPEDKVLPVLGICLGFQSLALEFGASVVCLPQPRHGIKTCVTAASTSIFEGLPEFHAVQYHSLHAVIDQDTHKDSADVCLWQPSTLCPKLQPLAWDFGEQPGMDEKFQTNPHSVLMAVKHIDKPFYGVQFHPESICSDSNARQMISNWWQKALEWSRFNRLHRPKGCDNRVFDQFAPQPGVYWWLDYDHPARLDANDLADLVPHENDSGFENSSTGSMTHSNTPTSAELSDTSVSTNSSNRMVFKSTLLSSSKEYYPKLVSESLPAGTLTVPSICKALDIVEDELVILDSEMRQLPQLGESSIIGLVLPHTKKLKYSIGSKSVSLQYAGKEELIDLDACGGDIFSYIKTFMSDYAMITENDRAFCGGLMGYITYEACLETIGVPAPTSPGRPDICFAFIEQSILIDHKQNMVYIQGLQLDGQDSKVNDWVAATTATLKTLSKHDNSSTFDTQPLVLPVVQTIPPKESEYRAKIAQCQKDIGAGNSYELCLTDQTSVSLAADIPSWDMYCRLRRLNPAPFAGYVRLGPLTLLSTSPERFMNWSSFQMTSPTPLSMEPEMVSTCQFRPIKGTVRKEQVRPDGSIHRVTRQEAETILKTQKEQAENLMIVDLIRHDLYNVCREVNVERLMVIEEYESVYQLVSVVQGRLFKPLHSLQMSPPSKISGVDCLAVSLPPGSMTGAPKRRTCELLRKIEQDRPRSIYSGLLGYMCVSGKGDFSVVIRNMYKWDEEEDDEEKEYSNNVTTTWKIGAGGAVTSLSTEEGEWEEMLTKLQSTHRLFVP